MKVVISGVFPPQRYYGRRPAEKGSTRQAFCGSIVGGNNSLLPEKLRTLE
jgi:hypothetical protein